MSGAILLIVEYADDADIIRAILKGRGLEVQVKVRPPTPPGGISRLAEEIEPLIKTALAQRQRHDCVAVLHDADEKTRPHARADYDRIRTVCEKFQPRVKLIIPRDELESWLLADSGICNWLNIRPVNRDEQRKPSDILERHLKKMKTKLKGSRRRNVLSHASGDGDTHSPSMREALRHLGNAPCARD